MTILLLHEFDVYELGKLKMSLKHSGNWKAAQRNAVAERTCGGITRLSSVRFTVHDFAITFIISYFASSTSVWTAPVSTTWTPRQQMWPTLPCSPLLQYEGRQLTWQEIRAEKEQFFVSSVKFEYLSLKLDNWKGQETEALQPPKNTGIDGGGLQSFWKQKRCQSLQEKAHRGHILSSREHLLRSSPRRSLWLGFQQHEEVGNVQTIDWSLKRRVQNMFLVYFKQHTHSKSDSVMTIPHPRP